jgi:cation diffusion facilitator family transporter
MSPKPDFTLPPDRKRSLRRARRIEGISVAYVLTVAVVMGLAAGSSQAMQTAWVEDLLALVPPIAFLVGGRGPSRAPNDRFPYGYHRATTIAFLVAAVAQTATGVFLLADGTIQLVERTHPSIGTVEILGHAIWQGWLMLAALAYSVVPLIVLGRLKLSLAHTLHDKALATDADLNKDDWLTGAMAALGVIGIGIGWWWADAAAAVTISLLVCRDGLRNLFASTGDLMDRVPMSVDHRRIEALVEKIQAEVEQLAWVVDASVRLREHGNFLTGEVFVVPRGERIGLADVEDARRRVEQLDWRLRGINIVPCTATRLVHGSG